MSNICSIISFCTYDLRYLQKCLESVAPFSKQIIVPICDHFYNGQEENYPLLELIYRSYPHIQFIEFAYSDKQVYGTPMKLLPGSPGYAQHWHNSARLIGFYFLNDDIDKVLFCDVDEIFSDWPQTDLIEDFLAVRFATYWYFLSPENRARETPDGPLLVKRSALEPQLLIHPDERSGIFEHLSGNKRKGFAVNGSPIVHHYSWVRTKEELLQKIRSWGHHWERNWEKLLNETTIGSKTDFVRGYTYETIASLWDPLQEHIPHISEKISLEEHRATIKQMKNVKQLTPQEVFRLEINWEIRS